ncbi:MAG: lysoplasmalogenase, partial [Kofleriaceae bacterium]|nr:lysoplasmalogenase [Kofleriaceae bacterium]
MTAALTYACAACAGLLVSAEYMRTGWLRIASKLAASIAFVLLGFEAFHVGHDVVRVAFAQWIFLGLVLGAVGDTALLGASNKAFLVGLVAFLGGHIAYVLAAAQLIGPADWLGFAGVWAPLPVVAGAIALAMLWPKLGAMRVPVIAYVLTIVAMVVAAIAVARSEALPEVQRYRFVVGAALFFVSDLAVARDR